MTIVNITIIGSIMRTTNTIWNIAEKTSELGAAGCYTGGPNGQISIFGAIWAA